ncbi:ABC transporter ATP-binding protein [Vaginella massiliensis]|uniref:ABC transporter ATP-binding protein n=1 Tax=Vaginella massiliensis TaxID=1816680 RepID=UPI0008396272|nr:ATP-binding cassette domain-containing protein [Vaginella massiliensis]
MDYLLEAKKVTKRYADKTALNAFDLNIPRGSIYGLLGPNGAGKTTFIRIINQITAPDEGEILLNGKPLGKDSIQHVGYMPEERGLYKNMKVGEQAMYFAKLKGMTNAEAKAKTQYWFDKLGISSWWNKKLGELSKGMGQKVQFVITVIHEPDLLIFDEPFSGFDPVNAHLIANEILELRDKGTTIIFSTHRMESVEEMCDHVALINLSNKVLDGTIEEVRNLYKTGKYKVWLNRVDASVFENFKQSNELHNISENNDFYSFDIQLDKTTSPNDLLKQLTQVGEIHQFNEIIPSMNDIFLQAVHASNHPTL